MSLTGLPNVDDVEVCTLVDVLRLPVQPSFTDPDGCEWVVVSCPRCTFRVVPDCLLHILTFLDARDVWVTTRHVNRVWAMCSQADIRIESWLAHRTDVVDARNSIKFTEHTSHLARNTAVTAAGVTACVVIAAVSCASVVLLVKVVVASGGAAGGAADALGALAGYGLLKACRGMKIAAGAVTEGVASLQAGPSGLKVPTLATHNAAMQRPIDEGEWDVVNQSSVIAET